MKLQFIGTGTMGSAKRKLTSVLVDDSILFDIGSGVVDQLKKLNISMPDITHILVSHYHVDHFSDIVHYLARRLIVPEQTTKKLTIVGPKNIQQKVNDFVNFTHQDMVPLRPDVIENNLNLQFEGFEESSRAMGGGISVKSVNVAHGQVKPCVGYVLEKDGVKLGYTGDARDCEGLRAIILESDHIFIDATMPDDFRDIHIGLKEICEIAKVNPQKTFYAIHRNDYEAPSEYPPNVILPNDSDTIEV
jgi:ribonuclease BN (tRNA processing enzyme)